MRKNKTCLWMLFFFLFLIAPLTAASLQSNVVDSPVLYPSGDGFADRPVAENGDFLSLDPYAIAMPVGTPQQAEKDRTIVKAQLASINVAVYVTPTQRSDNHRRSLASRGGRTLRYLDIAPLIQKYAGIYRLDPYLVKAVIEVESGFYNFSVSPSGACGLMQLMPSTARLLGCYDSFNPEENIKAGCKYLRELLNMFGNERIAVAAYNAGPGTVRRAGGIPNLYQTIRYVEKVFQAYGR